MKEIMKHFGISRDTVLIWIDKKYASHKNGLALKISEVDAWAKSGGATDK